ncbi:hypothetical protein HHK36_013376 [Tetracentron sinense]|uniref:Rhodanese domain-containing protein n=1 Tax=Tetracentron sinense TaxID=13715 RepID=A0A835DGI4_TETSI|nr:hypothetical protein HHK36_013376 [Tetracentron sinense]
METLTVALSSSLPIRNHLKSHKTTSKTTLFPLNPLQNPFSITKTASEASNSHHSSIKRVAFRSHGTPSRFTIAPSDQISNFPPLSIFSQNHLSSVILTTTHFSNRSNNRNLVHYTASFLKITPTHLPIPLQNHLLIFKAVSFLRNSLTLQLSLALMAVSAPFPCLATEITVPSEQVSDKINLESILISIDDFFNRNPFFVAGVTFIWLFVIPLTQQYLKKFKFISAIDAFRKLRDDQNSQLLDIRDKQTLLFLGSPNLKILNKSTIQVHFSEGKEEGFVKQVLGNFKDPSNSIVCVLDNFDGNSMKVAELLFKNGFKEAYAVKGGVRGKDGWQAIQETLLPPSVRILPQKKGKMSQQLEMNGEGINKRTEDNSHPSSSTSVPTSERKRVENGYINSVQATLGIKRPSSPYPNV